MNSSAYIFGTLSSGYTQYPEDNKKILFRTVADRIYSKDMIAIKRDGNLLYYIYAHSVSSRQSSSRYIGFAIELNGLYYNDASLLFPLFEDVLTKVVLSGKFVEFNDDGEIVAKTEQIHQEQGEVDRVVKSLLLSVENLPESGFRRLPPINYSVGINEAVFLSDKSTATDIDNALTQYNAINICKDGASSLSVLAGYSDQIKRLSEQIKALTKANTDLSDDLAKTKRQKKRTTIVTVLSLLIATAVIVIISVSTSLSEQVRALKYNISVFQDELKEKEGEIETQEKIIKYDASQIKSLEAEISAAQNELNAFKSENDSLVALVNDLKAQVLSSTNITLEDQVGGTKNQASSRNYSSGTSSSNNSRMSLSDESITINVGATKTLYAYNYGSAIEWESNNDDIATVTSSGVIKGVSVGTTAIWAKGKEYKRCLVTVVSK